MGQHARRGPRRRRRSRRAAPAGRARGAGQADAGRPAFGDAGRALRRPVAAGARARVRVPRSREVPRLRSLPPHVDAARDRAVRGRDRAGGSQHPRLPRRQVHVPERAAGASLRHRRRERHRLPPGRPAGRRGPRRRHHAGERADGVVLRHAHLARAARPLDPRQHPRGAAAGSAAQRAEPRRRPASGPRRRSASSSSSTAPTRPARRATSGWIRSGFGLENFDAVGAWRTTDGTVPIDASGTLPDGRSFSGPQGAARDPRRPARRVHARDHRQADDVCARPRPGARRPSRRREDGQGDRRRSVSLLERGAGDRQQPRLPDAAGRAEAGAGSRLDPADTRTVQRHPAPERAPQGTLSQEPGR